MVFLGRISYSVYLIHVAALGFTRRFTTHHVVSAIVVFGITVCYAAASWKWLEQRHCDGISYNETPLVIMSVWQWTKRSP
jgi:peptidoglycan/LPS O-acetylase OafA/YrhL